MQWKKRIENAVFVYSIVLLAVVWNIQLCDKSTKLFFFWQIINMADAVCVDVNQVSPIIERIHFGQCERSFPISSNIQ